MKNMKNLTSYLLTVALLVSPALLAQAAEQQGTEGQQTENAQPNQPPQDQTQTQDQTQNEERAPAPPQATPPSPGQERGNQSEGTTSPNEPTGQPSEQSVGGEKFIEQESGQQLLASKLIGSSVTNLQNENLGHVEDLILNQNGQATGLVISVGGFLGLGAKHVAIPLS
ncbi:MAG TPA: PRC-barrel domain-containing protein, partial [Nitrococcus sp.]|nr:PRC-barrel domain-containing protein [Nitrococcus sp.]